MYIPKLYNELLPLFPREVYSHIKNFEFLEGVICGNYMHDKRAYHTISHLYDLLKLALKHQQLIERPLEFTIAILFHDIVYEVGAKDNEYQSAQLADKLAWHCFGGYSADLVYEYIMATVHDGRLTDEDSSDARMLADFDLWSFAADYPVFQEQNALVEREFLTKYTREEYNAGRKVFLNGLLAREELYYFNIFSNSKARKNIRDALAEIG